MVVLFSGYVETNLLLEKQNIWSSCMMCFDHWEPFIEMNVYCHQVTKGDVRTRRRRRRPKRWSRSQKRLACKNLSGQIPTFPPNKALICKYVFVVTAEFSTSGGFLTRHWIQVHSRKYNNEELNFFTFKNSGATINSLWRAKKEQIIFFN